MGVLCIERQAPGGSRVAFACEWLGDGADGVLVVTGELDVHTAADVVRAAVAALDNAGPTLVLDLSEVTFMDCSGMSALLSTRRKAAAVGKRVRLTGVAARVQKLLRLTGVEGLFALDAATIVLPSTSEAAVGR